MRSTWFERPHAGEICPQASMWMGCHIFEPSTITRLSLSLIQEMGNPIPRPSYLVALSAALRFDLLHLVALLDATKYGITASEKRGCCSDLGMRLRDQTLNMTKDAVKVLGTSVGDVLNASALLVECHSETSVRGRRQAMMQVSGLPQCIFWREVG